MNERREWRETFFLRFYKEHFKRKYEAQIVIECFYEFYERAFLFKQFISLEIGASFCYKKCEQETNE